VSGHPYWAIVLNFCVLGDIVHVIICAKFYVNRFRDFGVLTSQILSFFIGWAGRSYNNVISRLHDTTGCQTGCQTGFTIGMTTVLNEQPLFVQPVVKPGCTTLWQPVVYTIQPVVKPVWPVECLHTRYNRLIVKPVWQPVVSCIQTFNRLLNRFDNRVDNRLYRVNGALALPRPLFIAAKFGWQPLLECRALTLPRREIGWNLLGCPKLTKFHEPSR